LLLACVPSSDAAPTLAGGLTVQPHHPQLASVVVGYLERVHYAQHKVDDTMSARWLDNLIAAYDPNRQVFLQADVDGFRDRWGASLDDRVRSPKTALDAALELHQVYLQRLEERVAKVLSRLDGDWNLADDEVWALDRAEGPWPTTAAEADDVWRKRVEDALIRAELRRRRGAGTASAEEVRAKELQEQRERYQELLESSRKMAVDDILELYLSALTSSFDPHSTYFAPSTQDNFEIEMSKSLEGIGARLKIDGDYTVVESLVVGGPAEQEGSLRPKDKILAVAQGDSDFEDVVDRRIDDVVKLIRGEKGTIVRLLIVPGNATVADETRVVTIRRDKVILEENRARLERRQVPTGAGALDVGVLEIPSFYQGMTEKREGKEFQSTTADVRWLLSHWSQKPGEPGQGAKAPDVLLVDLRQNGGGSLDEAIQLTGLFIDQGPVVQVRDPTGEIEVLQDREAGMAWDGPLVVLTSPFSASASEIFAGALQDYRRALVVGSRQTHGKGSVQSVIDLDHALGSRSGARAGALKLTTQMFYRVDGSSTQQRGVRPDVWIPSEYDDLEVYEADLDHALPWDAISPSRYQPWSGLSADLAALQAASSARVAAVPEFAWWAEDVAEGKKLTSISLNLETRQQEAEARKQRLAQRGLDANADDPEEDEGDDDRPDLVLDEALAVVADYVRRTSVAASP
jgi:carboxyl-terminal processing protease